MLDAISDYTNVMLSWLCRPLSPCSVEQMRNRLVRTLTAMAIGYYILRLLVSAILDEDDDVNISTNTINLTVVVVCSVLLKNNYISEDFVGDCLLWLFVIQYVFVVMNEKHLYSLTTFAVISVPILSAFIARPTSFVQIYIAVSGAVTLVFFRSLNVPGPTLTIANIGDLFTLLATIGCVGVMGRLFASQTQRNFDALASAAANVEQTNLAKTMFIANISHELRTPLHAILAAASFLKSADLSTEHSMFVNTILTCSDTIKALVGNVLDLSRIEADLLEWYCQTFDLMSLIEEIVGSFAVFAHNKSIRLRLNVSIAPPFRWQYIYTDKIRLKKILTNLVDNAVKFCNEGHVDIKIECLGYYVNPRLSTADLHQISSVRQTPAAIIADMFPLLERDFVPPDAALRRPPHAAKLRFEVTDTGIGIAPQYLVDVFEPFSQPLRLKEGPGLGLSVSQRLARGLGTQIQVASRQGEGSRFWFDLYVPVTERLDNLQRPRESSVPLAEGDSSISTSSPSGTVPVSSVSCHTLLKDLLERRAIGCLYFCDCTTHCGKIIKQQLGSFGFSVKDVGAKELATLVKERQPSQAPSLSSYDLISESATQVLLDLDVIVVDEQICVLEEILPQLQADILVPKSFCPVVVFLCQLGADEILTRTLTPAQLQRILVITKPNGPVKLLQAFHRFVDLLLAYCEAIIERPRRLLLPRPSLSRMSTDSSGAAFMGLPANRPPRRTRMPSTVGTPPTPLHTTGSSSILPRTSTDFVNSNTARRRIISTGAPFQSHLSRGGSMATFSSMQGPVMKERRPPPVLPPLHEQPDEKPAPPVLTPVSPMSVPWSESPHSPVSPAGDQDQEHFSATKGCGNVDEGEDDLDLDMTELSTRLINRRPLETTGSLMEPEISNGSSSNDEYSPRAAGSDFVLATERRQQRPILVVEDNPINQMIMKHLITKKMGLECEIVDNGRKALEAWSEKDFSLIFMDIQMPVMDGLTAMREIRRLECLEGRNRVNIVAMTGLAFMEDRDAAIEAGCDEFLSKPVDMEMLQQRVVSWLSETPVTPLPSAELSPHSSTTGSVKDNSPASDTAPLSRTTSQSIQPVPVPDTLTE